MAKTSNMDLITLLAVHDLLSISKARALGYQNLISQNDDADLSEIIQSCMSRNLLFSNRLKNLIKEERSYRVYVDAVRPVYIEWSKVRLAIDKDSMMMAFIEAERITYQAYKAALTNCLPFKIRSVIQEELADIYRLIPVLNLYSNLNKIEIESNVCKELA